MVNVYMTEGAKPSVCHWVGHNKMAWLLYYAWGLINEQRKKKSVAFSSSLTITWFQQQFNNIEDSDTYGVWLNGIAAGEKAHHNLKLSKYRTHSFVAVWQNYYIEILAPAINESLTTLEASCQSRGLWRTLGDGVHFI